MSERHHSPLLPPNQTPMEGALVQAGQTNADTRAAIDTLRALHDPHAAPARLLPWLAWGADVPLWPEGMDEDVRRGMIGNSLEHHRRAGTLAGFRNLARLADAELLTAYTQKDAVYCGPSLTREQREAFLARYPQLRIYPHRNAGQRRSAMFHRLFIAPRAQDIPAATDAPSRLGDRAYLWDGDAEAEITAPESSGVRSVRLPGSAGRSTFAGIIPRFVPRSSAAGRHYRISAAAPAALMHRVPIPPGLTPVSATPEWHAEHGVRRGLFAAASYLGQHFVPTTAADRIYQRYRLFDPARSLYRRGAALFVGAQRLRYPAYRAEIRLRHTARRNPRQFGRYIAGFTAAAPRARYRNLLDAMRWTKALRDQVLITTKTRAPAYAGAARAGEISAGQYL